VSALLAEVPRPATQDLPLTLTAQLIESARLLAQQTGQAMPACLQSVTGASPEAVMRELGLLFGYDVWAMPALQAMSPRFDAISFPDCVQRVLVGGATDDGRLYLVLADPFDGIAEDWALRRLAVAGFHDVRSVVAHADDVQAYLLQQEQLLRAIDGLDAQTVGAGTEDVAAIITLTSIGEDDNPVVKLVNSTIYDAIKIGASDVHLECDAGCLFVQYRIDGVLVPITQVQGQDTAEQVISRVKVMAELDIAERRVPQDGRFKVRVANRDIDFRVSVMPNIFGEDAVLRLLDRQSLIAQAQSLRLDHLGLDAVSIAAIRRLAAKPHGMLLVTGPTGSGKTTTLYATITEIHTGRDKIVTIEDPVEYRLPRVVQIPVNERKGLTFARGLRSILRHDPDKIMVGEIRDDETAQIAVQASLTGHTVFTTVHANSVFDVLGRFLHMGVDAYSFAAALNGIVAQRLVRINCPNCTVDAAPSGEELRDGGLTTAQVDGWKFRTGRGCGHCRGTGFKGRRAASEVLCLDDALRELIASRSPISSLKERAALVGLEPLRNVALSWVARGETTLAEVNRVAG
jgi:general secretion pathway protein E